MTRTFKTFILLCLLLLGAIGGAGAQTLIHSTDWTAGAFGSTTAGAAGTTTGAGDGWIDVSGGVAKAGSDNKLTMLGGVAPWSNNQVLLRPANETASARDQKLIYTFVVTSLNTSTGYSDGVLRRQAVNTQYFCSVGNANVSLYSDMGGTLTAVVSNSTYSTAPAVGDTLQVTYSVTGASPTTVALTVLNVTKAQTIATLSASDSTGPQVAGQIGLMGYPNGGVSAFSTAATYGTATTATTYAVSALPPSGPVNSPVTLTFTPNGTATATVTPTVSGVSGTFSPNTVALNGTTAVSVTFTPTTTGTATFSSTNNGGLADPASQSYTVTVNSAVSVGISSAAWRFSPGNWAGDTGRGGSVYRQTWNNGAYASCYWTAAASPTALLSVSNQTTGSAISYVLNGVLHDNITVPASGGIALTGITASAANVLTVYCRNSQQSARWNETNGYKITGLSLDTNSTAGTAPAATGKWVMEIGDSITEGIAANNGADSSLSDYSYLVGQSLLQQGYDYGVSACGYSGWLRPGDSGGDVPAYYPVTGGVAQTGGRWYQIDSTTSLLDTNSHISAYGSTGQEPAAITINYATNEALSASSNSDLQASVTQGLSALRGAAPNAWIFVYVPFNLYSASIYSTGLSYITSLKAGVSAYKAAHTSDTKLVLVDFGTTLSSQIISLNSAVHPNVAGHALIAADAAGSVFPSLIAVAATGGTALALTITQNGSNQPVLTWTADPAATLYKVLRSVDGVNYTVITTPAVGTLTYTDTARPAGATVYYHITSTH